MNAWVGIGIGSVISLFIIWFGDIEGIGQLITVGIISFFVASGAESDIKKPSFWGGYFSAFALIGLVTILLTTFI